MKSGLYLCKTPGKNWGLHAVEMPAEHYIALKRAVLHKFFEGLNPFLQSDTDYMSQLWEQVDKLENNIPFRHEYLFVEFWSDNQDKILTKSMEFADSIGVDLLVEDF